MWWILWVWDWKLTAINLLVSLPNRLFPFQFAPWTFNICPLCCSYRWLNFLLLYLQTNFACMKCSVLSSTPQKFLLYYLLSIGFVLNNPAASFIFFVFLMCHVDVTHFSCSHALLTSFIFLLIALYICFHFYISFIYQF